VPKGQAENIAHAISGAARGSTGSSTGGSHGGIPHQIRLDFAHSTQTVVYGMAAAMALAFVVALRAMPSGRAQQADEAADSGVGAAPSPVSQPAGADPATTATTATTAGAAPGAS